MAQFDLWMSELSPYALKIQSALDYQGHTYTRLPKNAGFLQTAYLALRLEYAKLKKTVYRYPTLSPLDEYPLVPYLITENGQHHYDSSAIAHWLDTQTAKDSLKLWPEEPEQAFIAGLIDEAFDEFMLYVVHHMRWVRSAKTNNAGERLANEIGAARFFLTKGNFAEMFSRRQIARLPYLFSVAPSGFDAGVSKERTPPHIPSWPETHSLIEEAWHAYLSACETLLTAQPYILGQRFCVADASIYGMFGMLLKDPSSAEEIQQEAPTTFKWLCNIRDRKHLDSSGDLSLSDNLLPLLHIIMKTFVPLMRQNESAYLRHSNNGQNTFNEKAFNLGQALYDGNLLEHPYKSAAKTFQVRVWQDICENWSCLKSDERERLKSYCDQLSEFDSFI